VAPDNGAGARPVIRAVILDFGGVIAFHPDEPRWRRMAEAAALPLPAFLESFWAPRLEYDAGRLEPAAYWRAVIGEGFRPDSLDVLVRREIELWDSFDSHVLSWTDELRAAGVRTGILSNLPRVLGEALRATPGFLEHFDHVTFSYELRSVKPEPLIYQHAVQGLGVRPEESLFLDDKMLNVEGARAAGLVAELYSTWEEFVRRDMARSYALPRG
jgi:putative hydrolase of the HAD superfamily